MNGTQQPWRTGADHLLLAVRLTPKAGRDRIEGIAALADGRTALAVKVRAVPDKGAANRALTELLAAKLRIPKSAVAVAAGHTARLKQIRLDGDPAELIGRLKALMAP